MASSGMEQGCGTRELELDRVRSGFLFVCFGVETFINRVGIKPCGS